MVGSVLIRYTVPGARTSGRANNPTPGRQLDYVRIETTSSRFRLACVPPPGKSLTWQQRNVRFSMTLLAALTCLRREIDYVAVIISVES